MRKRAVIASNSSIFLDSQYYFCKAYNGITKNPSGGPITPLMDYGGGTPQREKSNPWEKTYRDPAALREMQIIPLFVPALNNWSKRLLLICLTYTDLWSVAAVTTAQNKLSLGKELTESTGQETPLLKSRNFKFPSRFGSCKVSDWDQKGGAFPWEKQETQTWEESHSLLFPHQVIINLFIDSLGEGVIG